MSRKDELIAELKNVLCTDGCSDKVRIVILQRGWVFVGNYSQDGDECVLSNARCIRQWGTSKGLAELKNGPLSGTKLEESGTVRFNPLTVVATIDCEAKAWAKHL